MSHGWQPSARDRVQVQRSQPPGTRTHDISPRVSPAVLASLVTHTQRARKDSGDAVAATCLEEEAWALNLCWQQP